MRSLAEALSSSCRDRQYLRGHKAEAAVQRSPFTRSQSRGRSSEIAIYEVTKQRTWAAVRRDRQYLRGLKAEGPERQFVEIANIYGVTSRSLEQQFVEIANVYEVTSRSIEQQFIEIANVYEVTSREALSGSSQRSPFTRSQSRGLERQFIEIAIYKVTKQRTRAAVHRDRHLQGHKAEDLSDSS